MGPEAEIVTMIRPRCKLRSTFARRSLSSDANADGRLIDISVWRLLTDWISTMTLVPSLNTCPAPVTCHAVHKGSVRVSFESWVLDPPALETSL